MGAQKLFFSYSRNDAASFAAQLAQDLEKEGFDVWIDQQDIPAGRTWDLEIERALENCDCLLFIESQQSVVSNNVLDEVYYALGQNKKVIPVIFHDSKTPFRLRRLQHIDFTKDYSTGLTNLVAELRGEKLPNPGTAASRASASSSYIKRKYLPILALVTIVIVAAFAWIYTGSNNTESEVSATQPLLVDSSQPLSASAPSLEHRDSTLIAASLPTSEALPGPTTITDEPTSPVAKRKGSIVKNRSAQAENSNALTTATVPATLDAETLAGNWQLANVSPRQASHRGYIKIEAVDERRIKVVSNFQFYFKKQNSDANFVVFNGFASCASCPVKKEIIFSDKDISFGTTRYTILKTDIPGEGKAGDTTATIGGNSTVPAAVSLQYINAKSLVIKVAQPASIPISNGFVVKPFEYHFYFTKNL